MNECSFRDFELMTKEKLIKILMKIKRNTGIYDVTSQTILDAFDICGDTVVKIVNESLSNGICPNVYKMTK